MVVFVLVAEHRKRPLFEERPAYEQIKGGFVELTNALKLAALPIILLFCYWAALYLPAQSGVLRRSLQVAFNLNPSVERTLGYEASQWQGLLWIVLNLLFLEVMWLYCRFTASGSYVISCAQEKNSGGRVLDLAVIVVAIGAHVLFIGALIASPDIKSLNYLVISGVVSLMLIRAAFRHDRRIIFPLAVSLVFAELYLSLSGYVAASFVVFWVICVAWFVALAVCKNLKQPKASRWIELVDSTLLLVGLIGVILLGGFLRLPLHGSASASLQMKGLLICSVWFLPVLVTLGLLRLNTGMPIGNVRLLAAVNVGIVAVAYSIYLTLNGGIVLLALPLGLSAVTLTILMLNSGWEALSNFRPWLLVLALGLIGFALSNVMPTFLKAGRLEDEGAKTPNEIDTYLKNWDKRHKSSDPIVLVAAAGGGVRAAQHVASSLAHADYATGGRFGNDVFAISGVSGGALGALIWTSARDERLLPPMGRGWSTADLGRGNVLNDFFRSDLLSPSANTLLLRDLPLAALAAPLIPPKRDDELVGAWVRSWIRIENEHGAKADGGDFVRPFGVAADELGERPIMIFSSTSAVTGRLAIRSNISLGFGGGDSPANEAAGELLPDRAAPERAERAGGEIVLKASNVEAVWAALDSARFPIVSATGSRCANVNVDPKDEPADRGVECEGTYKHPVAIADGGYADNSGLVALQKLYEQLVKRGREKSIYIVYITSNPEEGRDFVDGSRFDPSSLAGVLLSPGLLMEDARAGRANAIADIVRTGMPDHFIEWRMSNARPSAEQKGATDVATVADLPPLGWTLDTIAVRGIDQLSESHSLVYTQECQNASSDQIGLCGKLKSAGQ